MTIKELTKLLFEDTPISAQTIEAKERIEKNLEKIYKEIRNEHNEIETMGIIMTKYNNIKEAGSLAGYSMEEIDSWSQKQDMDLKHYKKMINGFKAALYIGIFMGICTVVYIINSFVYRTPANLLYSAISLVLAAIALRKSVMMKQKICDTSVSTECRSFMVGEHDKCVKKTINTLVFFIAYIVYLLLVCIYLFELKYPETVQYILSQNIIIEVICFLLLKHLCMLRFYNYYFQNKTQLIRKQIKRIAVCTSVYFGVVLAGMNFIAKKTDVVLNLYYVLAVLAAIFVLGYNLTLRGKMVSRNIVVNKKRIICIGLSVALVFSYSFMKMDFWMMQPYISSVSAVDHNENSIDYDEETGVYTITKTQKDFKILQLTDIHLGGSVFSYSKDHKAFEAVRDLIEYTKPDFVMVTGDLVFPLGVMSYSLNNETPIMEFASFMRNIGIPWGFVYGNHESEFSATATSEDLNELFKTLSYKTSKTLLYPYVQPDITGRNNQMIQICNEDGSLNQALFLIDSNDYTNEGINAYDYIHDDQVEWYKENVEMLKSQYGENVSSLAFFHIPLQEYRTANDLYEKGDDQVKYFFGEIGETMINKICCSEYPSSFFDTAVSLNSTKAMFCGHDHYNNISLEYEGIRLTYGMSIDYLAMPGIENDTKQRGGTLITLHEDSSFDVEQVKLTDIQ